MIPKIIHYCWLSNDPIPAESVEFIKSWHNILHDYEFILWDRKNFSIDSVPWVKEAFDKKKYAFAADYIRLFAVYNYGGIYLDTDIEVKKSFNELLHKKQILGFENISKQGIEAGCFGAEKGDPFIGKCLSYYDNRHFIEANGTLNTKILPLIMSEFIDEKTRENIKSFDFFTAKDHDTGTIKETRNTYTVHHFAGSWLSSFEKNIAQATSLIYRHFGKHLFSRVAILACILYFRISSFGVKKTCLYYHQNYILKWKTARKSILSFLRDISK